MNNSKGYRENELKWYLIASLLLLLYLGNPATIPYQETDRKAFDVFVNLFHVGLISGSICILSYVFDRLYSSDLKTILLYLGKPELLPAKSVFSKIKAGIWEDPRFDSESAKAKYASIYAALPLVDEEERGGFENQHWRIIYNKYREEPMIYIANRDYLLCRDIFIATITLTFFYLLAALFRLLAFKPVFAGYLAVMLVLSNIATRVKVKRFVLNVLAFDIHYAKKD